MKALLAILGIWICSFSYADQLAYISQSEAEDAVKEISKMKTIYLFCGCCNMQKPVKINPIKVYSKFTNYENYYEVYVDYIDENGVTRTEALDLAYVWKKKMFKYQTIGTLLGLDHDQCENIKNWQNPKHVEENI